MTRESHKVSRLCHVKMCRFFFQIHIGAADDLGSRPGKPCIPPPPFWPYRGWALQGLWFRNLVFWWPFSGPLVIPTRKRFLDLFEKRETKRYLGITEWKTNLGQRALAAVTQKPYISNIFTSTFQSSMMLCVRIVFCNWSFFSKWNGGVARFCFSICISKPLVWISETSPVLETFRVPRGEAAGGADRAAMWRLLLARPKHPGVASGVWANSLHNVGSCRSLDANLANSIEVWFEQDEVSNTM